MLRSFASNPALRGRLQRAASNPSLRATTAAASVVPPMPAFAPSRTLVSTVLLTRDTYESNKVNELKGELKRRGLSTTGNRSVLIKRLLDNDQQRAKVLTSSATGDAGPVAHAVKSAGQSRAASSASKARSAPSSPVKAKQVAVPPETSAGVAGTDGTGATIPHPPDMEPGQVSANFNDPSSGGIVQPEKLESHATAPGVPPAKTAQAPITFEVIIPYESVPVEAGPEIPLMTSYFHPESPHYSGHRSPDDGPVAHMPKVRTVSGEETYLGGGVSHHRPVFDDADVVGETKGSSSTSTEEDIYSFSSAMSSLLSTVRKDLGLSEDAPKQATEISKSASSFLKDARDSISKAARGTGSNSASYSTSATVSSGSGSYSGGNTRPLNDQERSGLYALGGIVLGGYLLGGLGKQSKRKEQRVQQSIQDQVRQLEIAHREREERDLAQVVQRAEAALKGL